MGSTIFLLCGSMAERITTDNKLWRNQTTTGLSVHSPYLPTHTRLTLLPQTNNNKQLLTYLPIFPPRISQLSTSHYQNKGTHTLTLWHLLPSACTCDCAVLCLPLDSLSPILPSDVLYPPFLDLLLLTSHTLTLHPHTRTHNNPCTHTPPSRSIQ